ncbi:glycosyltransferase family 39 protein [candidate division KSB1 bacterium]|nr:glycosyltransferase family 39 protein [candidate division KSB1 bacterium]
MEPNSVIKKIGSVMGKGEIIIIMILLVMIFIIRLPGCMQIVIDWDESVYFTVAQDVVKGGVPYKTAWDHKGPMQYFIFVPIMAVFGNSIIALRIFTTLYVCLSVYFIFLIGKILFPKPYTIYPPLFYSLFFIFIKFQGHASNTELFMMLPLAVAVYFFLKYYKNHKVPMRNLFFCGMFSSIAFFFKPNSMFTALVFPIMLITLFFYNKRKSIKETGSAFLFFFIGGISIVIVFILYFMLNNAFQDFYNAFYAFNQQYVNYIKLDYAINNFIKRLLTFCVEDKEILMILSFISLICLVIIRIWYNVFNALNGLKNQKKFIFNCSRNLDSIFIFLLVAFSLIGVFWGRRLYPHYFLQLSLPFSLMVGAALSQLTINRESINRIMAIVHYVIIVICMVFISFQIKYNELTHLPDIRKYQESLPLYRTAQYIKGNTDADDYIYVLGDDSIIYFLSERRAPTKYFFSLFVSGIWEEILGTTNMEIPKFKQNKPEYMVLGWRRDYEYSGIKQFLVDNYVQVESFGSIEVYKLR